MVYIFRESRRIKGLCAAAMMLVCLVGMVSTGCSITPSGGSGGDENTENISMVSFYNIWADDPNTAVGAAVAAYEKEYKADVTFKQYTYSVYNNQLMKLVASGSSPDIIFTYWGDMPKMAALEVIQPVDPYLDVEKLNFQNLVETYMWKGKHYAGSVQQVQAPLIWYNRNILEKYGVREDPYELWKADNWTWDTFKQIALACTNDTNKDGKTDVWGYAGLRPTAFIWANSATFLQIENNGEVKIDWKNPAVVRAIEFVQDARFGNKPYYASDQYFAESGFNAGNCAMSYGTYEFLAYSASMLDPEDVGCVPFPTGPDYDGYYYAITNLATIARGAKNPEGAGRLCEMISEQENLLFPNELNLGNPVALKPLTQEHKEVIKWAADHSRVTMEEGWSDWDTKYNFFMSLLFWEKSDVISSLDAIEPVYRACIEDTLNARVAVTGAFKEPKPEDFENGFQFMTTEELEGTTAEITRDSGEVVAGGASLKLAGEDMAQVLAYSDPNKLIIPSFTTYNISVDYKILSASASKADFGITFRTKNNLTNDKDQAGYLSFSGAAGGTGTVTGQISLTSAKSDIVLVVLSGASSGAVSIDNIRLTEVVSEQ